MDIGYTASFNGDRMKFFKMIRNTTILQRVMIIASIFWLLYWMDMEGKFVLKPKMFFPIVLLWGAYWIINGIIEKWKNK